MFFNLIAAVDWSPILWWIDVIFKVSVGLGAVIFVHELGHFLVAKACGVKIEKFMVGFDIGGYKISRRWGETVYGIGILPLGGYVKMFGQDDDPAHIAEQMTKSQVNVGNANAVPVTGPSGETYYVDRRSYLAKSVPQRMAIISAGVVMNVIFAFIFAAIAYGMGVKYLPSIVSETVPGSPAWQAGLEPGDEIIQLGRRVNPTFMQLRGGVTLGDLEEGIPCVVRRAADGQIMPLTLTPTQEAGRLATIGITSPMRLTLMDRLPVVEHSPAARAKLVSPAADEIEGAAKLQGGDTIIRIGNVDVENYRLFAAELAQHPDKPLLVTIQRLVTQAVDDQETGAVVQAKKSQEMTFEVPLQNLRRFGLVMKMGPIAAVQDKSPAADAGLAAGDAIERIDGQPMAGGAGGEDGWDPMALPGYLRQAAAKGREVELIVRRRTGRDAERLTIHLKPRIPTAIRSEIPLGAPIAAEAAGIAYYIENEIHAILPDTPAAKSDLAPGDRISEAKIILPVDRDGKIPDPITVEFGPDNRNWPALLDAVQFAAPGTEVEFTVKRDEKTAPRMVRLALQPDARLFVVPRGFVLKPIVRTRKAATFADQLRYGWDETAESLTMVFRFLGKLGTQVPITALGGPVMIAKAAGYSASEGLPSLLIFLTMLSANLAVINFLPIPLLDGGHIVFLAYEGIRGRPASERFVVALHTAGFVFIVGLMLFVLALDLGLVPRNL